MNETEQEQIFPNITANYVTEILYIISNVHTNLYRVETPKEIRD